ncbi:hypothetical protein B9Y66_09600 [Stenotrophomonas maltophilia]|nr:hypothetical protein B9Y66_09600 [Stenotrophomonas maltophilia]
MRINLVILRVPGRCGQGGFAGRAAPCTRRGQGNGNGNGDGNGDGNGKSNGDGNGKSRVPVGWRGGSGCGGRREPVPGGLAAASMPRTPPQPDPPRLRQISAICLDGMTCSWWLSTSVDT